jgi:hypothetical protein
MKLKIVIVDLEIPPRVKRWILRIGAPLAVLLTGGALANASLPVTFTAGQTLTAANLMNDLNSLDGRITALQQGSGTLLPVEGGVPLHLYTGPFTMNNAGATWSATNPGTLSWGYGLIPAGVTIIGMEINSGLMDGCEIDLYVDTVHASQSPRILGTIVGFSNNKCADVGTLAGTYSYLAP